MNKTKKLYHYWECKKCGVQVKMPHDQKPMEGIKCPCGGKYEILKNIK